MTVLKKIGFVTFILLLFSACRTEYDKLENYYKGKEDLHQEVADSLTSFCKNNQTEVILKKLGDQISFQILYKYEATYYAVYFDSAFKRQDPDPDKTQKFRISLSTIRKFNELVYWGISSDTSQTFFAGKWRIKPQLGTQGNAQYGILISKDTAISNICYKRLSPNSCLAIGNVD